MPRKLFDRLVVGPLSGEKNADIEAYEKFGDHWTLTIADCTDEELSQSIVNLGDLIEGVISSEQVLLCRGWQRQPEAVVAVQVARALNKNILDADTKKKWGIPSDVWSGQIIGLWGAAKVGKDMICKDLDWPRAAFADELKADLSPICSNLGVDISQPYVKEKLRPLMVALGATAREVDPMIWVKRIFLPPDRVCVTDVRYLNEVKWIWEKGGIVFRIVRAGYGPANNEESRSFNEIEDYYQATRDCPSIPVIDNSIPGDCSGAVNAIQIYIGERWGRAAA